MRLAVLTSLLMLVLATSAHAGIAPVASLDDFDDFGFGARMTLPFPITGSSLDLGGTYFLDGEYVAFDADIHLSLDNSALYPLGGVQFATDFDFGDFRFNLGGGYGFPLGKLGAFIEGKAVLGDDNAFVATFGLRF